LFFVLVFAITLNGGIVGVWWGIVVANILSSVIVFIWVRSYIKKLMKNIKTLSA